MKTPQISIITPAYNAEKYIAEAIESVQAQSFKDYEHIIIDDGSTDGTLSIVKKYAAADNKIILKGQKNSGAASARNFGISIANGNYVVFLDGDDFLTEDALEVLYKKANTYNNDIILFNKYIYKNETKEIIREEWLYKTGQLPEVFSPKTDISIFTFIFAPLDICIFVRKEFIRANSLSFSEKFKRNEDILYVCTAIALSERASYIDRELYYYRVGVANNMSSTLDKHKDDGWMVLDELRDVLRSKGLYAGNIKRSFQLNCESVLWHYINGMSTPQAQKHSLKKIKAFADKANLGATSDPGDIYRDINFHAEFQDIINTDYDLFLWRKLSTVTQHEKDLTQRLNTEALLTKSLHNELDLCKKELASKSIELDKILMSRRWKILSLMGRLKSGN